MKKKNVWVLFYILALLIFMMYSIHYINLESLDDIKYTDYTSLLNTLDDKVSSMYYGNDEENIKEYLYLYQVLNSTKDDIQENYDSLFDKLIHEEYNFAEYFRIKNIYSSDLKRIDYILKNLETRVN